MGKIDQQQQVKRWGFLTRLAKDKRGNVLAMMAAMLIPMAALCGSAVDISRMYLVKVRLQQACDAAVLAGRKTMTDTSTNTTLDSTATAQANSFFQNNFKPGWMSTSTVTFTPSKTSDARVNGTASAVVPMTLMKMFGYAQDTITVTCQARYDITDTDVLFVLDTTGSMACLPSDSETTCSNYVNAAGTSSYTRPNDAALGATTSGGSANDSVTNYPGSTGYYVPEKSGSRIAALRSAVIAFNTTLAANAQTGTHIRYGFVTYTSTVNAGKAITGVGTKYMIGGSGSGTTNFTYQSRKVTGDYTISSSLQNTYTNTNQTTCNNKTVSRSPSTALTYDSSGQAYDTTVTWSSSNSGTCKVYRNTYGPQWTYQPVSYDMSAYVSGSVITDPSSVDGSTAEWTGCIETPADGSAGNSSFTTSSLPASIDPDNSTSSTALWAPMFPEGIYGRNYTGSGYGFSSTNNVVGNGDSNNPRSYWTYSNQQMIKSGFVSCGKPVRRLATMTAQDVSNYVNASDFKPIGGTYHDTGMIWGLRLIDPNGLWAADTAAWPGRTAPNRVIVFLTDGDMSPSTMVYGMYGIEYFDRRVSGGDLGNLEDYHNARFLAACAKAKSLNITVWTVALGMSTTTQLQQCATTTAQALSSTSGSDLTTNFQNIATQVARLRVSQ